MKSVIKKGLSVLLGSALIASAFLQPTVSNASSVPFTQGEGYQQGAYDTSAQQPTGFNWSGHSRFNAVNSNLLTKWIVPVKSLSFDFTPVVGSDGTVYIATAIRGTNKDKLIAINPDGTIKWEYTLSHYATSSPVISNDGFVYVTTSAELHAVNISTGLSKWDTAGVGLNNSALGEIAIGKDGTLYIGNVMRVLAVDPTQPSIKWSTDLKHYVGQPIIDKEGNIYVQSTSGLGVILSSLDSNGNIRWSLTYGKSSNSQGLLYNNPLLDDQGNVYIAGRYTKELYSISTSDGSLNWKINLESYLYTNPTYDDVEKVIYIGTNASKSFLYAINLDGSIKWKVPSTQISTSPTIDNKGDIYVNELNLLRVYSKYGELLATYNKGNTSSSHNITIGEDGTLYFSVSGNENAVYAVTGDIILPPSTEPGKDTGTGLNAEYFNNEDLTDKKLDRIDSNIDFDWDLGSPDPLIDPETYSVRWTGKIQSDRTGTHNFHIYSDDGARLWIDNKLIIDHWEPQGDGELVGGIWLEAGKKYDIKMEYFNGPTYGRAQLSWSDSDYMFKEIVPSKVLFLN